MIQRFYHHVTQYNYNFNLNNCTVILKAGILIKNDADFYNSGIQKKRKAQKWREDVQGGSMCAMLAERGTRDPFRYTTTY